MKHIEIFLQAILSEPGESFIILGAFGMMFVIVIIIAGNMLYRWKKRREWEARDMRK